ncbi:hypothetical protein C6Z45_23770 [Salmonella enterica]|nr:hypothetical protein [Salmonella enterica]
MHNLECMKMHDFLQAEKAAKPSPGLASMRFSQCMRIDLLIKKRAGSASPRGGGRGLCIPDQEKQSRNFFSLGTDGAEAASIVRMRCGQGVGIFCPDNALMALEWLIDVACTFRLTSASPAVG